LAENEAELDAIDLGGNTPLHLACAGGHAMAVRTMLEFAADTSIANRSGDTAAHFAASMGREECIHLLLDYNLDLAHARNLAGSTPMQAARSTGQVRLVKAIQQRLQVRANELNPPTQIASTPTQVDGVATSNDEQTARTLHSPPSMLSVTEEVDPFEDQWSVPGPPPTHSPPSTSGQELVQRQQRQQMEDVDAVKEALRRRPGDRADISSDSESDDDLLGNAVMAPVAVLPSTGHIAEDYGDGYWDQNKSGQHEQYHEQYHEHWGEEVATQAEVVSAEDATTVPVWQEMYDDHHQAVYYLDTVSGHSQWERPHDFVAGAGTAEVVDEDGVDHDSYREDLSNETWSARYDYVDEKDNDIPPPPKNPPERELSFSM